MFPATSLLLLLLSEKKPTFPPASYYLPYALSTAPILKRFRRERETVKRCKLDGRQPTSIGIAALYVGEGEVREKEGARSGRKEGRNPDV